MVKSKLQVMCKVTHADEAQADSLALMDHAVVKEGAGLALNDDEKIPYLTLMKIKMRLPYLTLENFNSPI